MLSSAYDHTTTKSILSLGFLLQLACVFLAIPFPTYNQLKSNSVYVLKDHVGIHSKLFSTFKQVVVQYQKLQKKQESKWLGVSFRPENFIPGLVFGFIFGVIFGFVKIH